MVTHYCTAVVLASYLGRDVRYYEDHGAVQWPRVAEPVQRVYKHNRREARRMAEDWDLWSFLPVREQVWRGLKTVPAELVIWVRSWFSVPQD